MTKEKARLTMDNLFPKVKEIYLKLVKITKISLYGKFTKRLFCELYFNDGTKKHTQVARVLLEVKLGRVLDKKETVDHIDGDALNNSLDNLQMLSLSDNAKKGPTEEVKLKAAALFSKNNKGRQFGPIKYGEDNGMSKLTEEQVIEIKQAQKKTYKGQNKDLSEKYNVTYGAISQIRHGRCWKHITV